MQELKIEPQKVYVGLESPRHASRTREDVEFGWNKQSANFPENLRKLNIDELIVGFAEKAEKEGREEIAILDVGSGPEGKFVSSFLENQEYPELHGFLKNHPKMKVRVVGMTGAKKEQGELLKKEENDRQQIVVENYGYTITSSQTVENFLKKNEISNIDAAFANFSTGYFTPTNFAKCLEDVSNLLIEEGAFYGITYNWVPAGFRRTEQGEIEKIARVSPDNPLYPLFHPQYVYEVLRRDPNATVSLFLQPIDFVMQRQILSQQEVYDFFLKEMDSMSTTVFKDTFFRYAIPAESFDVRNNTKRMVQKARREGKISFITQHNWNNVERIVTDMEAFEERLRGPIRESDEELSVRIAKSREVDKQILDHYRNHYQDVDQSLPGLDILKDEYEIISREQEKYIENKYAIKKRFGIKEQIRKIKTECHNWDEVKLSILSTDSFEAMHYWQWDMFLSIFLDRVIEKLGKKTFSQKQDKLNELKTGKEDEIEVVFNELDFYIRRKSKIH